MAEKKQKTQAEKTASAAKSKKNIDKGSTKKSKTHVEPKHTEPKDKLPVRLISSVVLLGLAVLFTVILFADEGALLKVIENLIHGLIGRTGYIVSIPVLFYLFYIHAFSGKRPIKLRTVCLIFFVLLCGCISHLNHLSFTASKGFVLLSELYSDGVAGESGGVLCGLLTIGIHWLCGTVASYILFILAAITMLFGGMGITVSGLIQAYRERPRPEWEEEE